MYKILIVDDEAPARRMLNSIIDWKHTNFEIVGVASNGKMGIEKYKELKPDCIITDIQMPVMDGIEMIEEIRKTDKNQKFVILSCHEDFNYARKALKMGVTDYLIKDLITKEIIYELLLRISSELYPEDDNNKYLSKEKQKTQDPVAATFSEILRLNSGLKNNHIEYTKEIFEIKSIYMAVFAIRVDSYANSNLNFEDMAYIAFEINKILKEHSGGKCFSINNNGKICVLAGLKGSCSKVESMKSCNNILQKIRNTFLKVKGDNTFTIGISDFFSDIGHLKNNLEQATKAMKLKLFLGNNRNIYYRLFPNNFLEVNPKILKSRIKNIKSYLLTKDEEKIMEELENIYHEGVNGFMQYNYLKYVNSKLFNVFIYEIDKNEIPYKDIFNKDFIPINFLNNLETVDEICNWFKSIFKNILDYKTNNSKIFYSKHIHDTFKLINENYADNDLSLTMLADRLALHKVYLCRIFKEETQKNIKDVIQAVRIEKAKELIKLNEYKLYEIANMVGYATTQQLNIYFKKIEGVSPNTFRVKNY